MSKKERKVEKGDRSRAGKMETREKRKIMKGQRKERNTKEREILRRPASLI